MVTVALGWLVAFACCHQVASGLKCITCDRALSNEECNLQGEQQCHINQNSCEAVVRRYKNKSYVRKGCKETMACSNNQMQNNRPSGKSTQCNGDQVNSFCTCCCEGDLCNVGTDTCLNLVHISVSPQLGFNDCATPPRKIPHGIINCENGVCRYQCTSPTYELWPAGRDENVCGADGNWQFDTPCCARPCPPHSLFDSIVLSHSKPEYSVNSWETLSAITGLIDISAESTLFAGVSYGAEPYESSVINFNDYEYNKTLMLQIFQEKRTPTENGVPVNTGAAIQYAIENLLQSDKGMRDERVPKAIFITTDSNSDDDVKTAAKRARDLGYFMYVYAFERDGVTLDDEQLLDITGDPKHIFKFGMNIETFPDFWWQDLVDHFCEDPCVHVLHDHS